PGGGDGQVLGNTLDQPQDQGLNQIHWLFPVLGSHVAAARRPWRRRASSSASSSGHSGVSSPPPPSCQPPAGALPEGAALAASTAAPASSSPAPHTAVVQMHSLSCSGFTEGSSQKGGWGVESLVVGKGRAVLRMSSITCCGVRPGFTANISAAAPDTSGAEKLVPTVGCSV